MSSHVNHFLSHRISAMQLLSVYVYRQIIKKYFFYNKSVYGAYEFSTSQRWHLLKKVVSKLSSQFYYPCHLGTRFSLQYSRISF